MIEAIIHWSLQPEIHLGSFSVRWYGILFATGVVLAYFIVSSLYEKEGIPEKYMNYLLLLTVAFAVVGARLGEVFFYSWDYFKDHLYEIPMTWKGGLSSHGATIGIIISAIIYSQWVIKKPFLWVGDKVVVGVAIAAAFVRFGNFANSEIFGFPTQLPWAVVFQNIDSIPRHPTQIYEAISYLIICAFLFRISTSKTQKLPLGAATGWFLVSLFSMRFLIEFLKENQQSFEEHLFLNMGQLLSLPFILMGVLILFRSYKKEDPAKTNA